MQEEYNNTEMQESEDMSIDFLELFGKLWKVKRTLIWASVAGLVFGIVVAFSIPKNYSTEVKMAPEFASSSMSGADAFNILSMAGINLNNVSTTDAVNPMLYPEIVSSVPFLTGLFDVPVTTEDGDSLTLRNYIEYKMSSPWWISILKLSMKSVKAVKGLFVELEDTTKHFEVDPFRLSKDQMKLVETLTDLISSDVDAKTAVITVNVKMQDPMVSALIADTVVRRLQEYVIEYRTEKARNDLAYAEKLNEEAKSAYHIAQQRYAAYVDRNHGIASRAGQTEEERLQNDMNLTFSIYNSTAQQYQYAKAKVQEITPVYSVFKPATVPIKGKPSKLIIILSFMFLGMVGTSVWVLFGKDMMSSLKEAANSTNANEPSNDGKK